MKILILYYELAAYNIICLEQLNKFEEIHVVAYPVSKEAPFSFNVSSKIIIYNRINFDLAALQNLYFKLQPAITFCAGWNDKDYLTIASNAKESITVLGFDNEWTGQLKQRIGSLLKRGPFQKIFDYAFVPGDKQKEFANKLGFSDSKVMLGAYSCDFNHFKRLGYSASSKKSRGFPQRFLYVGRYIHRKGIYDMWEAFVQIKKENPNDWELWCVGIGEDFEKKVEHPSIKHFGFVQPNEMNSYINNTGVFILPSHFEPWGVVVHEFASAGFPLILSSKVGAGNTFLENGHNGFSFPSKNVQELKKAMLSIMNLSGDELFEMGRLSIEKAEGITPSKWAETFENLANQV